MRQESAKRKSSAKVFELIENETNRWFKRYLNSNRESTSEEIYRRFAMINKRFIVRCWNTLDQTLRDLKISLSPVVFVSKVLDDMLQAAILMPDVGPAECNSVLDHVAEFISQAIIHLKNNRLKRIGETSKMKKENEEDFNSDFDTEFIGRFDQMSPEQSQATQGIVRK